MKTVNQLGMGAPVYTCPQCKGRSQIEDVENRKFYIYRIRACVSCGSTWTTAEVPLAAFNRLRRLDEWMKNYLRGKS